MKPPVWFLDIDGVINAVTDSTPAGYRFEMVETMGQQWPIRWRPEVVDFVNRVSRNGLAEVRWLTTWEQDASANLAPALGFDEFDSYDIPDSDSRGGWWKTDVVTEFIATEGRPFVWTDDDLAIEDVSMLRDVELDHLALSPAPAVALSDEDLARIHHALQSMNPTERTSHP